ncbi:18678_t:CDS:2, partial [Funneliformis geosporum]
LLKFLNECYERYGPIFETYIGDNIDTHREVYLCKPEYLEKLFTTSTKCNFILRSPNDDGINELGFGNSGMVMNSELNSWKRNRKLSVPLLMNTRFLKSQVHVTQVLFKEMENYWNLLYDESIVLEITSWINSFTLDLVITSSLGKPSFALKTLYDNLLKSGGTIKKKENTSSSVCESSEVLLRQIKSFFKAIGFFKQPSWLRHTFLIYYNNYYLNEMRSLNNRIENYIKVRRDEILLEMKNGKNVQEDRRDIMSLFLLKYSINKNQDDDEQHSKENFDDVIRSNLIEVLIGGAESTSNSISFIVYYLCKYPHVKKKLFDEIDLILSSNTFREITFEDIEKFEYAEAIIKEVSRFSPVSPLISRSNVVEDEIDNYSFREGTQFHAFLIQIYKNPEYFTNPEEFNPDRFMKGSENVLHNKTFLPFGSGLRICPGKQSAIVVLKTFLMCFFRKYNVEFLDENQKLNTWFDFGLHCVEYKVVIKQR